MISSTRTSAMLTLKSIPRGISESMAELRIQAATLLIFILRSSLSPALLWASTSVLASKSLLSSSSLTLSLRLGAFISTLFHRTPSGGPAARFPAASHMQRVAAIAVIDMSRYGM